MSATTQGIAAGVVFGAVVVLLGQQFGFYSLSDLAATLEYLIVGIVLGAVIFGVIGRALGRRYLRRHPVEPAAPPPSS